MKRVITAIAAALLLAIIPMRAQAPTMSFTFTGLYAYTAQPQFSNYRDKGASYGTLPRRQAAAVRSRTASSKHLRC
jgi:hypothetical protein